MQSRKRGRKPALQGCIITACTTGAPRELQEIQDTIKLLGGIFSSDICDDLTHLICKEAGGQKHRRVCLDNIKKERQNKVFIVKTAWLHQCLHASIKVNEQPYFLPPLLGFAICCTGLETEEKSRIEKISHDTGAKYSRILDTNCTHLICETPSGKKYDFAKTEPNINIVRSKWVHECGRLNTLVDETPYLLQTDDARDPAVSYGTEVLPSAPNTSVVNAIDANPHSLSRTGLTLNTEGEHTSNKTSMPMDAAILFFSISPIQDKDQYVPLQQHAIQLAKKGGATISAELNTKVNYIVVIRTPVTRKCAIVMKNARANGIPITSLKWLELSVKEGKLLPHEEFSVAGWSGEDQGDFISNRDKASGDSQSMVTSTIFQGIRVALGPLWLRDANQCATVSQQLISGRAKVLRHDASGYVVSGVPTHVVCPADSHSQEKELKESITSMYRRVILVTGFWVDSCIARERLLPANSCILFQPLNVVTPLTDVSKKSVVLTISGFQKSNETDWNRKREILSRLAVLLGAKYSERMRRRYTTHLIADDRQGLSDKMAKAHQWGIHVVTHEWLLECARCGHLVSEEGYNIDVTDIRVEKHESENNESRGGKNVQTEKFTPTKRQRYEEKVTPRKSARKLMGSGTESPKGKKVEKASLPPAAISLFKRFTEGLNEKAKEDDEGREVADVEQVDEENEGRSRSVSRDAVPMNDRREWSMDASQSQVIMHRDLTPPPRASLSVRPNVRGVASRTTRRS